VKLKLPEAVAAVLPWSVALPVGQALLEGVAVTEEALPLTLPAAEAEAGREEVLHTETLTEAVAVMLKEALPLELPLGQGVSSAEVLGVEVALKLEVSVPEVQALAEASLLLLTVPVLLTLPVKAAEAV
jgi:hypothetical protein